MAEKFFDVCGVQIEPGDVVELVEAASYVQSSFKAGDRLTVAYVARSAASGRRREYSGDLFVRSRGDAALGEIEEGAWGKFRVIGWTEQPRDVKTAVVRVGHLCGTATTEPVRPHLHDDRTMGPRYTCAPCLAAVPPTGPRHARLLETGRTRSDVPNVAHARRRDEGATLPTDAKERKAVPVATGVIDYFPDALAAVAGCSKAGGEQHNPGKPLHWDRSKSGDESDALMRHFLERGTVDTDGIRHSAKVAWRALALLQKEIEAARSAT